MKKSTKSKKNTIINNNALIALTPIILFMFLLPVGYYIYSYYSKYKRMKIHVQERMKILPELYKFVADVAEENNIKLFLLFGSLLGQQRNNKLICYDYDFDMGMFSQNFDKLYAALKANINLDKHTLVKYDHFYYGKKMNIIDNKTSLNLDIDVYEKQSNGSFKRVLNYFSFLYLKYISKQCNKRNIPRDWLLPLKPVTFLGKKVYIPHNPGALLECEYGKDYLTPNHKCNKACTKCVQI